MFSKIFKKIHFFPLKKVCAEEGNDNVVVAGGGGGGDDGQRRFQRQCRKNRMPTEGGTGIRLRQQRRRFEAMNRVYNS